ncbi:unnamed protein product [Lasius platythorax]|uniref:Uncharacterized protein n=1 Tax=Lasius platythorax TaxID=488582 RepID=A0AAV2MXK8_9HYME
MQLKLIDRFKDFFEINGQEEVAALAAITHPQFKDRWLACLSDDKIIKVQQLIGGDKLLNNKVQQLKCGV